MSPNLLIYYIFAFSCVVLVACDLGCETIANPGGPAFLQVENESDASMKWSIEEYAFTAEMKKGECTIFGLGSGTHDVKLSGCAEKSCRSVFIVNEEFTVAVNETHIIQVSSDYISEFNEVPGWIQPIRP